MNFKTTYFLFGLLAVMFLALAVSLFLTPEPPARMGYLFPSMHVEATKLDTDAITKITIERKSPAGATLVLEKEGKAWQMTEPRSLPADSATISNLLLNLRSAKLDPEAKPISWQSAGLNSPSRVITLEGGGRTFTLMIGEVTEGEERGLVFAESSERRGQVLTIRKGDVRAVLHDLAHFRAKDLIANSVDVTRLRLTQGKKAPLELKKVGSQWSYVSPAFGEADATDVITSLGQITVRTPDDKDNDFVADQVPVAELAKYNLDPAKADVLKIEVWHGEKPTTVLIGTSKKEGDKHFATLDVPGAKTRDVVKVPALSVEKLVKLLDEPGSLRNKNLVKLEGSPDAIDVTNAYGLLEFRRVDPIKDWELYRGTTASKVDVGEVRKLIDAINRRDQITKFLDASTRKELGVDRPDAVVIKIWADSLEKTDAKKDDPKTAKPTFRKDARPAAVLRVGLLQGDSVAVERQWGDSSTLVLVPRELFTISQQRPLDYFDKSLPSFNPGAPDENVTKVEITRADGTYEVTRDKGVGPWKIVKPESLKGRLANDEVMRSMLGDLNRITAREIVAETVEPKDLGKDYDLEKAPVRVSVTLSRAGKDTKHDFDFGKEKAGKGVYARMSGNPAVYVVDAALPESAKKDLRDPTVLSFDPDKVTSVTFKGWQKVVGSVSTLTVERKGSSWAVKDRPDFKLDTDKVENLMRSLTRLQAEKFVPAPKGVTFAEGAFAVEITMSDKKVLVLTVGADEGASVYAQSSELKGEAVLIRGDLFTGPRGAPAYFSK